MLANGEAPSWPCAAAAGLGVPGKLRAQAEVAGESPRHAAGFQSTCGQHAGSWLAVFPMSGWATARARHYQLGLVARLGLPMVEFMPIAGLSRLCRFFLLRGP